MSAAEVPETETLDEPETDTPDEPETAPDEPETDTPDEPDAPADDEPSLEAVEAELRDRDKKLEKERGLHEKRLSALYGEEWASHVMCPLCIGEGYLVPWQPGEIPPEQIDAMDALSGRYTPPEYVDDPDYEKCAHCDGHGKTVTGSQNPEHLTKLCDKCSGNGFTRRLYVVPPPEVIPAPGSPAAINAGVPVNYGGNGAPDKWGRPPGHVHYGIEPQFVTA